MIIEKGIKTWNPQLSHTEQQQTITEFEKGNVILLPQLDFLVLDNERNFLTPDIITRKRKNISFDLNTKKIKGINLEKTADPSHVNKMLERFAHQATQLVKGLFPSYVNALEVGRTSFRPVEIKTRKPLSPRKDDRLLHVDSFAATPTHGKRILRLFSNINPHQLPRCWRLGEDFTAIVDKFIPQIKKPLPFSRTLKKIFKVTKAYQSLYDYYMLNLHHTMKADAAYQAQFPKIYDMSANTTWLTYTDKVSHAATSGQYLLEQTFYLPIAAMQNPQQSPLNILQRKLQQKLV